MSSKSDVLTFRDALQKEIALIEKGEAVGKHRKKPRRLAEKLLAIRVKLEVSQSQLATLLELKKDSARLSEYEHGVREPDLMTLLKYAKLARVSLEVLADDSLELKFPKSWKRPGHAPRKISRRISR